ncbi:MAG: hypothetical protein IKL05_05550 [Clostridia bacterium]|nr:hypothetical protein [Clostridia bacterium]
MFHRLKEADEVFFITHKKPFDSKTNKFKEETIKRVFEFAYDMTFANKGEHRNHRTGGTTERKNGEIFANTFQGKLAECAACNLFYKIDSSVFPDFSVSKLGTWDSVDIVVNNKKIAIKSTKSFGNLLLLEKNDWDENGNYIPNKDTGNSSYDFFVLVRISPFCEDIMRNNFLLYENSIDRKLLWEKFKNTEWLYDYAGYISLEDFKYIIKNNYFVNKGTFLNKNTRFDADNYYVQAGDMNDVFELLKIL